MYNDDSGPLIKRMEVLMFDPPLLIAKFQLIIK